MSTPRTKGFALLRFSCSPPFLLAPPPTSLCRGGSGKCEFSLPFSRRLGLENGRGGSLWCWEEQEMWLGLPRLSLVLGWAQGWWLAGEGVVMWKSIAGSFTESVLESLERRTMERGRVLMLKTHLPFCSQLCWPLDWKSPSGCYCFGFPFPFVLKNFPTCIIWGNLWYLAFKQV